MVISKDKFNNFLDKASEAISSSKAAIETELEERGITEQFQKTSNVVKESSFGKSISKASESASETLDELSGKKILELVEERLDLQESYNNLLASKLDEALTRIEKLESKQGQK